jgi:hypothetical protein
MMMTEKHVDYSWLKKEREFRLHPVEKGYAVREVIPVGENLYDPQFGWLEADGSITFSDIGGQQEYGWDPNKGHGAILSLSRDGKLKFLVPPQNMGTYMPLCPVRAPDYFGPWGGHMMLVGQSFPGRSGALKQHFVFKYAPGEDRMTVFAEIPHSGKLNDGVPGAAVTGGFGPPGSPQEGYFFVQSLMNCTVYRVDTRGRIEPWLVLDAPTVPKPIMPLDFQVAPDWWGDLAGQFILYGKAGQTYREEVDPSLKYRHYHVDLNGKVDPTPLPDNRVPAPIEAVVAPPEFGPFAGQLFWVDEGGVDLNHVTMFDAPLPYSAKLMRTDRQGKHHVFADNFQGASTLLVFDKERLLMSVIGKSYSTGDYHHPDGSIYEVRYTG